MQGRSWIIRVLAVAAIATVLLALLSVPASLTADAPAATPRPTDTVSDRLQILRERGRLVVSVTMDAAPWGLRDGAQAVGFEPDLARDLAARLGVEARLVAFEAERSLRDLAEGRVDLVLAPVPPEWAADASADLIAPPYYSSGIRLVTLRQARMSSWAHQRGSTVCVLRAAPFMRDLAERLLMRPRPVASVDRALAALRSGRCTGWAVDGRTLETLERAGRLQGLRATLPSVLERPWHVAVPPGAGDGPFGRAVAAAIVSWHGTGAIAQAEADWDLARNAFARSQVALWAAAGPSRAELCPPQSGAGVDQPCFEAVAGAADLPPWIAWLGDGLHVEAAEMLQLLRGVQTTVSLGAAALAGSLFLGVVLGWLDRALADRGGAAWLLGAPLRAALAAARMTPPILMLYFVFFGLGAALAAGTALPSWGFVAAVGVLSLWAGAGNAVLVSGALHELRRAEPARSFAALVPAALARVADGLGASALRLVKAVGLASTLAVAELVHAGAALLAEGADARGVMALVLGLYLALVLMVTGCLALLRRWAWPRVGIAP